MVKKICIIHTETTGLHELRDEKVYKKNLFLSHELEVDTKSFEISIFEPNIAIRIIYLRK